MRHHVLHKVFNFWIFSWIDQIVWISVSSIVICIDFAIAAIKFVFYEIVVLILNEALLMNLDLFHLFSILLSQNDPFLHVNVFLTLVSFFIEFLSVIMDFNLPLFELGNLLINLLGLILLCMVFFINFFQEIEHNPGTVMLLI